MSEHWSANGTGNAPTLKHLIENLAFYPLLSLFMVAIDSAFSTGSVLLKFSAAIFSAVVVILLFATALQTLSIFLSIAIGALSSAIPKNKIFRIPVVGRLPAGARPYGILFVILVIPALIVVFSIASMTFVLSSVILGLLDS